MNYKILSCLLFVSSATLISKEKPRKETTAEEAEQIIFDGMRTFAKVFQISTDKHYRITDLQDCINEAIKRYLNYLDPHSSFLDQKTYKRMLETTSGEFYGIGIVIDNTRTEKDKTLLIIDTIPEGPADTAGLKPLDKIVEIDGESLEGMSTDEAITKIKGERNTTVHIKALREGKSDLISLDITRDVVKEQNSLCFYLEDPNVYYISLTMFSENAVRRIEELLKKAQSKPYKALILDLRNNTGGLLSAAVDIAGLFLKKGSFVVSTRDKKGSIIDRYVTTREPIANNDLPIFILINNYTASAAEILAGCLKIHSDQLSKEKNGPKLKIFLVGSKSFGKGSVQEIIPIGSNSAAKITTSFYFLPQDISIQAEGITPDFLVEKTMPPTEQVKWFQKYYGRESALPRYIKKHGEEEKKEEEKKKTADTKKKPWSQRAREALEKDNQLREAVTLINTYHFAQDLVPEKMTTRQDAVKLINEINVTDKPLKLTEVK